MSKVVKMPKTKLDEFLAKVNLQDTMRTGNIDVLLRTMEDEYGLTDEVADDKETKLMDIWSTSDLTKSSEVFEKWDKEKSAKEKESA